MAEIFKQGDKRWADIKLGESDYNMRHFGCLVTAVAQSLADAGHDIDPGKLVTALNKIGGFTKDGLLIWAKVPEVCPQFTFNTGGDLRLEEVVAYEQGQMGRTLHWILRRDYNNIVEPYMGVIGYPSNWIPTGRAWICTVHKPTANTPDPAPAPAPEPVVITAPEPIAEVDQEPVVTPEPAVVVKDGDALGDLVLAHYGEAVASKLWGKNGVVAKVAAHNGLEKPDLIHPGDIIKFPNL